MPDATRVVRSVPSAEKFWRSHASCCEDRLYYFHPRSACWFVVVECGMRRWEEHAGLQHQPSCTRPVACSWACSVAIAGPNSPAESLAYPGADTIAGAITRALSIAHSDANCVARTSDCGRGRKLRLFQRDRQCRHAVLERPGYAIQLG